MGKIIVISTSVKSSGTGAKGPWQLSEVTATKTDGTPIEEKLKTFDTLPAGEVDVTFERQDHEKYGTSYLLKLKGAQGGGGGQRQGGAPDPTTAEAIRSLQQRVTAVEQRLDAMQKPMGTVADTVAAFGGPMPTDDDIPF